MTHLSGVLSLPLTRPLSPSLGSLGFADLLTGDGQWNILIRTLEAEAQAWILS